MTLYDYDALDKENRRLKAELASVRETDERLCSVNLDLTSDCDALLRALMELREITEACSVCGLICPQWIDDLIATLKPEGETPCDS